MKRSFIISVLLIAGGFIQASAVDYETSSHAFDLYQYGLYKPFGTARSMAMANAFGALGGDLTSLSINPAGIGVYRTSEMVYSQDFSTVNTQSNMLGTVTKEQALRLMPSNGGMVACFNNSREKGLVSFNLAFAYNKLNNFKRRLDVNGRSLPSSMLDHLNVHPDLREDAWDTYLLDESYNPILEEGETVGSRQYMTETGKVDCWDFALGFNYSYWLYMGFSIGIQSVFHTTDTWYVEDFQKGGSLELDNQMTTTGSGVNAKMGVIVRPLPELRLGVAYHTPTYYTMYEDSYTQLAADGVAFDASGKDLKPYVNYTTDDMCYGLETPGRWVFSAAVQLGTKGLVSMDWETVDYRGFTKRDPSGFPYDNTNREIDESFRRSSVLRAGLEWRFSNMFSGRLGYGNVASPVRNGFENSSTLVYTIDRTPQYFVDKGTQVLACGVGFKFSSSLNLDVAFQDQINRSGFHSYYESNTAYKYGNQADVTTQTLSLVASLGIKF